MKNFINTIKELYNKNPMIFLIGFGIIFIIIVLIISLFGNESINTEALIAQPLQYYEEQEIVIPESIIEDESSKSKTARVYDIDLSNKVYTIEKLITNLGVSNFQKQNQGDVVYTWTGDFGLIEYIPQTQTVSLGFRDGYELNRIDSGYISIDTIEEHFQNFTDEYIGLGIEYGNFTVEREGKDYVVYANQIIDGLPLHTQGYYTHSDKLVFSEYGNLMSGKLILLEVLDNDNDFLVDLVHPTNLNDLISEPLYPKEINQGPIDGLGNNVYDTEEIDNHQYDYPKVTSTSASSVELVYFYSTNSITDLIPTYFIQGSGELTFKGREYIVPMTIYVNALNPDNVLIPSDVEPQ